METRICRLYGKEDLRLETMDVAAPQAGEVLVRVMRGGICGSDLHYYQDGGFGPIRVREPIIMGHEFSGEIQALGPGVDHLQVGDRIGINPSQPCGTCWYCQHQLPQHCLDMHFIGSAFRLPHEQGGFREHMVVKAEQCAKGGADTSFLELACAEPLAVCLHAAQQAPPLAGKQVLINGAGPIGALCTAVAQMQGAGKIIVVDLFDKTLEVARQMGAHQVINLHQTPQDLETYAKDKGQIEVLFECSAAQPAMENIFKVIRPGGTIVQVGVSGPLQVPLNALVAKEVQWRGSHRFHNEYQEAVDLISAGTLDVSPMVTATYAMEAIHEALVAAADRSRSVKVQVAFA